MTGSDVGGSEVADRRVVYRELVGIVGAAVFDARGSLSNGICVALVAD